MNLAVLMASGSPWSRQVVRRLGDNGHRVVAVAVTLRGAGAATRAARDEQVQGGGRDGYVIERPLVLGRAFPHGPKVVQLTRALPRIVRDCASDALLTLYGGNFALAAWLSRVRPYAVYVVGSDVLLVRGFERILTRMSLNAAHAVLVNGEYLAQKTRELAPRAPIHPLLMGVDTSFFSPPDKRPLPVRIVCTRAFKPVYDNERLIEALRLMEGLDVDFRMTFTSAGPLLDQVRAAAEKSLSPGMNRRIEFLGGVSDEALRDSVRRSHIYVSMSLSDGTSTSLLEAMACGAFPIVSDIPQNREWIEPEAGNGILVPTGRPEALAEALRRAIVDPAWRDRAAGPNRTRVVERASSGPNTQKLAAILESITHAR